MDFDQIYARIIAGSNSIFIIFIIIITFLFFYLISFENLPFKIVAIHN